MGSRARLVEDCRKRILTKDELIIVPLGILLVIKLIPSALIDEFRAAAETRMDRPISRAGALFVILVWLACAMLVAHTLL